MGKILSAKRQWGAKGNRSGKTVLDKANKGEIEREKKELYQSIRKARAFGLSAMHQRP